MMKYLILFSLVVLLFSGFGCQKFGGGSPKIKIPDGWSAYENSEYSFKLGYPSNMEMRDRDVAQQDSTYAGMQGKFFASLRDVKRETKPVSIALFYAMEDVDLEGFEQSLVASDKDNISIKEVTDVTQGDLALKKVVSSTALGIDKTHYLFWKDNKLVVVSVILDEEEVFDPILATLQMFSK